MQPPHLEPGSFTKPPASEDEQAGPPHLEPGLRKMSGVRPDAREHMLAVVQVLARRRIS